VIADAFSLTYGFLATVSLALGVGIAAVSPRILSAGPPDPGGADEAESRLFLLFSLGQALVCTRLAAWPLMYAVMQSLVPVVPGAMCIFGVTRESGPLAVGLQVGEPAVVFLGGAWYVAYRVYRESGRLPAVPLLVGGAAGVALAAAAQSIGALAFLFHPRGQVAVACCSTVFDLPGRFSARIPATLLGPEYQAWLLPCLAGTLALILGLAVRVRREPSRMLGWPAISAAGASGLLAAGVGVVTLFEVAAPRILGQPGHHCLYDVPPAAPTTGLFLGAFVLGTFCLGWGGIAGWLGPRVGDPDVAARAATRCVVAAAGLLVVAAVGIAIHVAIA
jgi:hypothetical protein